MTQNRARVSHHYFIQTRRRNWTPPEDHDQTQGHHGPHPLPLAGPCTPQDLAPFQGFYLTGRRPSVLVHEYSQLLTDECRDEFAQHVARRLKYETGNLCEEVAQTDAQRTNYVKGGSASSSATTTASRNMFHLLQAERKRSRARNRGQTTPGRP